MVFALTATTLTIEEVIEIDDPAGKLARIKYTRRGKGHAEAMDGESIIFANDTFISAELKRIDDEVPVTDEEAAEILAEAGIDPKKALERLMAAMALARKVSQ
jgi:predicted metal-binding transcription factor (methanogenesis marker protein 9)